jgi:2-phosphosulfolactate phosphatase
MRSSIAEALNACDSGRELIEHGFAADTALAAQWDVSQTVPFLSDGA